MEPALGEEGVGGGCASSERWDVRGTCVACVASRSSTRALRKVRPQRGAKVRCVSQRAQERNEKKARAAARLLVRRPSPLPARPPCAKAPVPRRRSSPWRQERAMGPMLEHVACYGDCGHRTHRVTLRSAWSTSPAKRRVSVATSPTPLEVSAIDCVVGRPSLFGSPRAEAPDDGLFGGRAISERRASPRVV